MERADVLVVGAGISGAAFAAYAARAGRRVVVVEKDPRAGGCLHTRTTESGFWFELGAHTAYNSYREFIGLIEACGLRESLQPRAKPVLRFLDGDSIVPGTNLPVLLRLFDKLELLRAVPRWFGARREGETVRSLYSRLVGPGNYERVLGPMLSAVPSQDAGGFPASMLFKKRERRKDVLRSFTLQGGLQAAVEALLRRPGIELVTGRAIARLSVAGSGWTAALDDGSTLEAGVVAIAAPPSVAAALLRGTQPEIADRCAMIRETAVESLGFAVRAERATAVPPSTFLIPLKDSFHSVVTRDVVPDPSWRGFTLHFRPEGTSEARRARALQVLRIRAEDLEDAVESRRLLPSPAAGHEAAVREIDARLAGRSLALCGNWFGGLAIEDCVLRSRSEWTRVASAPLPAG